VRIIVLGGGGFVGRRVEKRLLREGHDVAVFRRSPADDPKQTEVRRLTGDVTHLAENRDALRRLQPDAVIHMQALSEHDARETLDVFNGHAGRVTVISSMDVYASYGRLWRREPGEPDETPASEEGPLRAKHFPYKDFLPDKADYEKILVERAFQAAATSLPYTILRLGMVHGEGDTQQRLYEYIRRMEDGRPAILIDAVKAQWRTSRCYVENCAAAVALATTHDAARNRVFNVGEQHWDTEADWIRKIAACMEWPGRVLELPIEDMPPHLLTPLDWRHHLMGDTTRIRDELEFSEPVPEEEWLRASCEWQRGRSPEQQDHRIFDYDAEDAAIAAVAGNA